MKLDLITMITVNKLRKLKGKRKGKEGKGEGKGKGEGGGEGKRKKKTISAISVCGNKVYSHILAYKMFLYVFCEGTKDNFLNFEMWKLPQRDAVWYKTNIQAL